MSRTITISTDVFAAIWARRKDGEENEDSILRREFGCPGMPNGGVPGSSSSGANGVYDARNNVRFPEGFEIFRTYKRREYRAQARSGMWLRLDNNERYPTLNQLNSSIAAGAENVWNGNWKYRASDGTIHSINELRP